MFYEVCSSSAAQIPLNSPELEAGLGRRSGNSQREGNNTKRGNCEDTMQKLRTNLRRDAKPLPQTKQSLVYDLQEPFRWLIDVSAVGAFQSCALDLHDFYFTGDDYSYYFEIDAKQRFIDLIRGQFNAGATYKGRVLKWDTVIEQKTGELGRFLIGRKSTLDFIEPGPKFDRQDNRELRAKILAPTVSQAREFGIGKSTLHDLRRNINKDRFRVYESVATKLRAIS
jgi:CRISPR-associated protein Cas1